MPAKSNTKLIMKIIEVLDKLGISQHDCILAEKYLSAEVGDEILDEFERMGFVEPVFQVNYELYEINKQVEKIRKRAVCVIIWIRTVCMMMLRNVRYIKG